MMIQRYDIHPVLNRLQTQMNDLLEGALHEDRDSSAATAEWTPLVDILEYDDRFEFYADMPGIAANAIEIGLENNVLTVSGERTKLFTDDEKRRSKLERPVGRFHRQFVLPNVADSDDITASSHDGVLQVIIKKKEQAKARKIEVLPKH
ncbi:MAG: Hsp20/alpha crystallin family protein [Gammaproteobacteria bacterium]|nr:Hsp20/alpha crystallin family protein [Gammaproteobacteria bacterium]MBT8125096.1 Hsp20/alpha crystallin family protein [Gammaproteobacteria bacterium]NNC68806.1 Hsp20/alpha crystallin family protein [Gammaproteobacteria bacterium]